MSKSGVTYMTRLLIVDRDDNNDSRSSSSNNNTLYANMCMRMR